MVRQTLFIVQFPTSAPVCQVEDFPRGTPRSVDGALHVRPGGTKKITSGELAHLRKIKPWGTRVRVNKKVVPPAQKAGAKTPAPTATPLKEMVVAAERVPKGGGTTTLKKVGKGKNNKR